MASEGQSIRAGDAGQILARKIGTWIREESESLSHEIASRYDANRSAAYVELFCLSYGMVYCALNRCFESHRVIDQMAGPTIAELLSLLFPHPDCHLELGVALHKKVYMEYARSFDFTPEMFDKVACLFQKRLGIRDDTFLVDWVQHILRQVNRIIETINAIQNEYKIEG